MGGEGGGGGGGGDGDGDWIEDVIIGKAAGKIRRKATGKTLHSTRLNKSQWTPMDANGRQWAHSSRPFFPPPLLLSFVSNFQKWETKYL